MWLTCLVTQLTAHMSHPTSCRYFIHTGMVEVSKRKPFKNEDTIITMLGPGNFFGEGGLLTESRTANASVRVPEVCEGYELSRAAFKEVCDEFPEFYDFVRIIAAHRVKEGADAIRKGSHLKRQKTNLNNIRKHVRTNMIEKSGSLGSPSVASPSSVSSSMIAQPAASTVQSTGASCNEPSRV